MPVRHKVVEGDGISSIAETYGFAPKTIWDFPENKELREKRPDPNVLAPGDIIIVPDLEQKSLRRPSTQRHTFRRVSVPALLTMQLLKDCVPRANLAYTLTVNGKPQSGVTDANGQLEEWVPCALDSAVLRLQSDDTEEVFPLVAGRLLPFGDGLDGAAAQQRFENLGIECDSDDETAPEFIAAVNEFCEWADITPTDDLTDDVIAALEHFHDHPNSPDPEDPE